MLQPASLSGGFKYGFYLFFPLKCKQKKHYLKFKKQLETNDFLKSSHQGLPESPAWTQRHRLIKKLQK